MQEGSPGGCRRGESFNALGAGVGDDAADLLHKVCAGGDGFNALGAGVRRSMQVLGCSHRDSVRLVSMPSVRAYGDDAAPFIKSWRIVICKHEKQGPLVVGSDLCIFDAFEAMRAVLTC